MKAVLFALEFAALAIAVTTIEEQGGELIHSAAARCKGPWDVDFFENVYGDDAIDRYFCKNYILDRRVILHPVQLDQDDGLDSATTNPIPHIAVHDTRALQNYLNNVGHLSSTCSSERLNALICARTFQQCIDSSGPNPEEFTGVPWCKEFCTYVLGCTFDVEECRSAPSFDIDDPEACAFFNPALIDSSSTAFAVGLLSLLG